MHKDHDTLSTQQIKTIATLSQESGTSRIARAIE